MNITLNITYRVFVRLLCDITEAYCCCDSLKEAFPDKSQQGVCREARLSWGALGDPLHCPRAYEI